MLDNFPSALKFTGALSLKRVILVTGAKLYGVHLGAPKNSMCESDPWLIAPHRLPNPYYRQQDTLHNFCARHSISWVVTYPNDVIGFAEGNFINLGTTLGLYAAMTKELGTELVFPGSERFYVGFDSFTCSKLHARFCVWAALEPRAAGQAFNAVNGDVESWQTLWPKLAKRFGLRVKSDQFAKPPGKDGAVMELVEKPPVADMAAELGLVGSRRVHQEKTE